MKAECLQSCHMTPAMLNQVQEDVKDLRARPFPAQNAEARVSGLEVLVHALEARQNLHLQMIAGLFLIITGGKWVFERRNYRMLRMHQIKLLEYFALAMDLPPDMIDRFKNLVRNGSSEIDP